jgi:hypothetical protein
MLLSIEKKPFHTALKEFNSNTQVERIYLKPKTPKKNKKKRK